MKTLVKKANGAEQVRVVKELDAYYLEVCDEPTGAAWSTFQISKPRARAITKALQLSDDALAAPAFELVGGTKCVRVPVGLAREVVEILDDVSLSVDERRHRRRLQELIDNADET